MICLPRRTYCSHEILFGKALVWRFDLLNGSVRFDSEPGLILLSLSLSVLTKAAAVKGGTPHPSQEIPYVELPRNHRILESLEGDP